LKNYALLLGCLLILISTTAFSTVIEKCATMQASKNQVNENPDLLKQIEALENFIQKNKVNQKKAGEIITIPVIFHVVYKNDSENLSTERLMSQIDVLNEDFRKLNENADKTIEIFKDRAADFEIEFCLAQTDPEGFPSTGINRVFTDSLQFTGNNGVKFTATGGADAWPATAYLNFWVCDLESIILGYAQFPERNQATDGVVVDYTQIGRGYVTGITGRTATHEIGHWMNLRHIWGDEDENDRGNCMLDDFVEDTPPAVDSHNGCPLNDNSCPDDNEPDMVQNYMDYSADNCLTLFTEGQKQRARAIFEPEGPRHAITQSNKCTAAVLADNDIRLLELIQPLQNQNLCTTSVSPVINFRNFGNNTISSVKAEIFVDDVPTTTSEWNGELTTGSFGDFELSTFELSPGNYKLKFLLTSINNSTDENPEDNEITINIQVLGSELPLEQGFESNTFPPDFYNLYDNEAKDQGFELNTDVARSGTNCMYINCFKYESAGNKYEFVLPILNLKDFENTELEFYNAYARYDATDSDTLEVLVSKDCGSTFKSVFKREGALLASEGNTTSTFVPSSPEKWKLRTVDLSEFDRAEEVIVKFVCINSNEQNLYIDDIAIKGDKMPLNLNDNILGNVELSPNPAINQTQLIINKPISGTLQLHSIDGKVLEVQKITFQQRNLTINLENYNSGTYFLSLNSKGLIKTFKLVVLN